jgi:hypothetical protein
VSTSWGQTLHVDVYVVGVERDPAQVETGEIRRSIDGYTDDSELSRLAHHKT